MYKTFNNIIESSVNYNNCKLSKQKKKTPTNFLEGASLFKRRNFFKTTILNKNQQNFV